MSLKYEPTSVPQHTSVKWLILNKHLCERERRRVVLQVLGLPQQLPRRPRTAAEKVHPVALCAAVQETALAKGCGLPLHARTPARRLDGPNPLFFRRATPAPPPALSNFFFFFFFTLGTGPRRSLSLALSDTRVSEPQIRARLSPPRRIEAPGRPARAIAPSRDADQEGHVGRAHRSEDAAVISAHTSYPPDDTLDFVDLTRPGSNSGPNRDLA